MITGFDKGGIAERLRKRFTECYDDCDYEGAFDVLLKYSEATDYPEFHMAAGMLYTLMTLDSDDSDLLYMAYREFMSYLRKHPDCAHAYRNALAVDFLRVDAPDLPRYLDWFKESGVDGDGIIAELIATRVISSTFEPPDLELLFDVRDFGSIYLCEDEVKSVPPVPSESKQSNGNKVIAFRGGADGEISETKVADKSARRFDGKISSIRQSELLPRDGMPDADDGDFDDDNGNFHALEDLLSEVGLTSTDGATKGDDALLRLLQKAEMLFADGEYSLALEELAKVPQSDRRYYIALCLRALAYMELGEAAKTRQTIDEALALRPGGALIGTIACEFYERTNCGDKIPATLAAIDVTDFMNGEHVFKAAYLALRHCSEEQALDLIEEYIEEYNLLDMRLIYAQLLYNRGERAEAIDEMYTLTRIFYDDILVKYFYLLAKSGVDRMPNTDEMPQDVLSAIVDTFMAHVENAEKTSVDGDTKLYGAEFFLTLEFRNERNILRRMFDVVRKMAESEEYAEKMRDTLISPYAEPLVKAVALGAFMEKDPAAPFLFAVKYRPYSDKSVPLLESGYRKGLYRGYAFATVLLDGGAEAAAEIVRKIADRVKDADVDECELAYFVVKHAYAKCNARPDDRLSLALGCRSKAVANRACAALDKRVRNVL